MIKTLAKENHGQRTPPCSRPHTHCRTVGLSLVEVLISLAIVAMLLTATGIAFDAALKNYKINHDMASVSISARNALYQMTGTIRSAWNLDSATDPDDAIYVADDAMSCSLRDSSGREIIYRYDDASRELQVNVNIDDTAQWYVMVENVFPVTVGEEIFTATYTPDGLLVSRVEIRFQVSREGLSRTISAAVVPWSILYGM